MNVPDTTLEILTLGHFRISVDGKPVATEWPDETVKVFFCSLLSPLDLYVTWDRICRSMLGAPETQSGRNQLEEMSIRPLSHFLNREMGFNPVIIGKEGIRIDRQRAYVDAFEFHNATLEGLRLLSLGDYDAAHQKFYRAKTLYIGSYLPGITGKIVTNTRRDLENMYRTAVIQTRKDIDDLMNTRYLPVI